MKLLQTLLILALLISPCSGEAREDDAPEATITTINYCVAYFEVTAYTDFDGDGECDITASGTTTGPGTIAAPPEIPFGTRMYIEGYGEGIVRDRGGDIQGNRLDAWMASRGEALRWGRKTVQVIIYEEDEQ